AAHDHEPLLAAELVVVRPRRLAGRELVQRPAEQLAAAKPRADRRPAVPVSVALFLRVPVLRPIEVEDVHASAGSRAPGTSGGGSPTGRAGARPPSARA